MSRYEPPKPRLALVVAALMMTATTFAVLVVLPSEAGLDNQALAMPTDAGSDDANPRAAATMNCLAKAPT